MSARHYCPSSIQHARIHAMMAYCATPSPTKGIISSACFKGSSTSNTNMLRLPCGQCLLNLFVTCPAGILSSVGATASVLAEHISTTKALTWDPMGPAWTSRQVSTPDTCRTHYKQWLLRRLGRVCCRTSGRSPQQAPQCHPRPADSERARTHAAVAIELGVTKQFSVYSRTHT